MKRYAIKEIFYSLQGEGHRAGTANVFIRFAGCNEKCEMATHGFNCDTDFSKGHQHTAAEITHIARACGGKCNSVILTGGEPMLQIDKELRDGLWAGGFRRLCIETNGTLPVPIWMHYVTVSPKGPESALRCCEGERRYVHELRYVMTAGKPLPKPETEADHHFLSPAFDGEALNQENIQYCIDLIRDNPKWRLSCQQHKYWGIR